MSPTDHMKRVQLERDVLQAKNVLTSARVEYEMTCDKLADARLATLPATLLELDAAVQRLMWAECEHAIAVYKLETFQREVMS